jgi:membrane associated rhomboid family serine protease
MDAPQQVRSEESLRHEYTEAVQTVRHYSNLRFAIFTIFFAVIGGVGYVAFAKAQFDAHASLVARIAGFAVVAVFWVYEERAGRLFDHHRQVAVNLERALGYTQFVTWPAATGFPPAAAIVNRIFFLILTLLWLYAVFFVPLGF